MPVTNAFLDRFVAQGFSSLTNCELPDLSATVTDGWGRIHDFMYSTALMFTPKPGYHTVFFTIIRRALSAAIEYEGIRAAVALHTGRLEHSAYSPFFDALYRTELCVSATAQAYQFIRKISELQGGNPKNLYTTNDGSPVQRLVRLYNASGKHIQTASLTQDQVHAMWLTNDGVKCVESSISWKELASMVSDVGDAAAVVLKAVQGGSAPSAE